MTHGVLIVDDDQFIRKLIATTLEDVAEFELHEASDGVEALEVAQRERPSLVFLDVDMPRLNGIEACRQLRGDDATGNATIVMLTAAHGDSVESDAEEAGADLFLTKPFSPLDLLRLVDQLGERQAPTLISAAMTRRAWLAFAVASVIWGVPYLFIKIAVRHGVTPPALAWGRVTLGALVLLALAWRAGTLREPARALALAARLRGGRDRDSVPDARLRRGAGPLLAGRDHGRDGPADRGRCWRCASTTPSAPPRCARSGC